MKRACYIAGRMRGIPRFNFPAFFDAERRLKKVGWKVYNPARMDVQAGIATSDGRLRINAGHGPQFDRACAKRDLIVIINKLRAERGDAVVMLPGWRKSRGARAENALARWVGLRRLTLKKALKEVPR